MDDATLGRLFRAFQQADNTVHRTHGGTGLGLSISKALVELWGGRIYARSQLGKSLDHSQHKPTRSTDADNQPNIAVQASGRHSGSLGARGRPRQPSSASSRSSSDASLVSHVAAAAAADD